MALAAGLDAVASGREPEIPAANCQGRTQLTGIRRYFNVLLK